MMNPNALWKLTMEDRHETLLALEAERLARKVQLRKRVNFTAKLSRFLGFVARRRSNRKEVAHA
ncbi:hypothetical protein HYR54_12920 [Candidatus Acetothermia bacterium]|nr:hypothetical protein [Candidatus Acetothermia bacterium]